MLPRESGRDVQPASFGKPCSAIPDFAPLNPGYKLKNPASPRAGSETDSY
jgi:hypothetical protein